MLNKAAKLKLIMIHFNTPKIPNLHHIHENPFIINFHSPIHPSNLTSPLYFFHPNYVSKHNIKISIYPTFNISTSFPFLDMHIRHVQDEKFWLSGFLPFFLHAFNPQFVICLLFVCQNFDLKDYFFIYISWYLFFASSRTGKKSYFLRDK